VLKKIRSLFYGSKLGDDIDREISGHLAMEIEHRKRRGMSDEEARRTALRDFGGVEKVREEVRDARGMTFWDVLKQDTKFGLRSLRRSPDYTLAAVMILALGIGANTAMFSVINGVLVKPLPFRAQDRIVLINQHSATRNVAATNVSLPEFYDYRDRLKTVGDLVEYHQMNFNMLKQGDPARVNVGVVSHNFFGALGVAPLIGRDFVSGDDELGSPATVMLSYEYWQTKFSSDPSVVGRVVEMNDKSHTIIGVLPPFPQYPQANDLYMSTSACPFRALAQTRLERTHRMFANLSVFGWLKPGATAEQATAEIQGIAQTFPTNFAKDYANRPGFTGAAEPLKRALVGEAGPMLLALSGATLLVLVIACANVANLSISRSVRRGRELAVRTALGAGRGRIARQLITESLIVSVVGGALGVGIARVSLIALVPFIGRFTQRTGEIWIDTGVLIFTFLAALVTGVICGTAPALIGRKSIVANMRDGAAQAGESSGRARVRSSLVVAQVTVSFVLLTGASLLLASVYRLSAVPLGYQLDRVVGATVSGNFFPTTDEQRAFWANTLDALRASPGVVSAAATNAVPLAAGGAPGQVPYEILGRATDASEALQADTNIASEGYFEMLGVKPLRGRTFQIGDTATSLHVAVINATMAKAWHGGDPIGSYIRLTITPPPGTENPEWQIVGVMPDVRQYSVTSEIPPQMFVPLTQGLGLNFFPNQLIVRASADPDVIGTAIRTSVHKFAPNFAVEDVASLAALKRDQLSTPALSAGLLTSFAAVALLITLAGIAGMIGTSVTQRTREFGVRLALGASPWSIVWSVLGRGLSLVGIGIAAGLLGANAFSQVIARYLFHTTPTDPRAYAIVAVVFLAAASIAAFAPARRITRIDPLKVLRNE
jgi:putative ABC transport system permease protein